MGSSQNFSLLEDRETHTLELYVTRLGADPNDFWGAAAHKYADTIRVALSAAATSLKAVAVDTTKEYREIDLGSLRPAKQTIKLPATSDWAVAVGKFRHRLLDTPILIKGDAR